MQVFEENKRIWKRFSTLQTFSPDSVEGRVDLRTATLNVLAGFFDSCGTSQMAQNSSVKSAKIINIAIRCSSGLVYFMHSAFLLHTIYFWP